MVAENLLQQAVVALRQRDYVKARQLALQSIENTGEASVVQLNILGVAYKNIGEYSAALSCFEQGRKIEPENVDLLNNMGSLYLDTKQYKSAQEALIKALRIDGKNASALNNYASCFFQNGYYDEALHLYEMAYRLSPNISNLQFNLGVCSLLFGDLRRGFQLYNARFQKTGQYTKLDNGNLPLWDTKSSLEDKRIVLLTEQGFGDTLFFVRFVPAFIHKMGINPSQVQVQVQPALVRLLQYSFPDIHFVSEQYQNNDCYFPMLSLPWLLRLDAINIPSASPYVSIDKAWKNADNTLDEHKKRVGICWQGSRTHDNDHNRSIGLGLIQHTLMQDSTIAWYAVQKDIAEEDMLILNKEVVLLNKRMHDFAETAVFIDQLNSIVTVDTAVAHLAAAMGKKVILLIATTQDWRWFRHIKTSPWYANVHIIRQQKATEWDSALEEVAQLL